MEEHTKRYLSVLIFGHVDAGKSTIIGHLLRLMGLVDDREFEKNRELAISNGHPSWLFAYLMDSSDEERARGKTIETGRAFFETPTTRYTILDAPGHRNYLNEVIGSATHADVGVLVVSARKGEFETGFDGGGTTIENTRLVRACGVRSLVVAVNKLDDPSIEDPRKRYSYIVKALKGVISTLGFLEVVVVPISGFQGTNLVEPSGWFGSTRSLVGALESLQVPETRSAAAPLRFSVSGSHGQELSGKVESGVLRVGDVVRAYPSGAPVTVLAISAGGEARGEAGPREVVVVKTTKLEERVTVLAGGDMPVVSVFEALITVNSQMLVEGARLVMHLGPAVEEVVIKRILDRPRPRIARHSEQVRVGIATSRPVALERFDDYAPLGRFVLRDAGVTIAVGRVRATARDQN